MDGKEKREAAWHETRVMLRADIQRLAVERGIDIGEACNQALAILTGTMYPAPQGGMEKDLLPVIIAKDGTVPVLPKKKAGRRMQPVINADDPAAPSRIAEITTVPQEGSAVPESVSPAPGPVPASTQEPGRKPHAGRKEPRAEGRPKKKPSGTDALRAFFSSRVIRTGDPGDYVGKEEFYNLFARFCHGHHISPVPEQRTITVAMKNRFAMNERDTGGVSSWTGIRLK